MTPSNLQFKYRRRRAVLISGGLDSFNNYPRFLNDLKVFYDCLVNVYRFAASDVTVLYANGGTHDMGGHQVVADYCNKARTLAAIQRAVTGLQPRDLLIVMTTNHGKASSPHDLQLWGPSEKLTAQDLGIALGGTSDYHLLGVFGECYGGNAFLDVQTNLQPATQQKCVLAASSTNMSWSLPPDDAYDAFLYYFTAALARKTPSGYPVDADGQGGTPADGHILSLIHI